MTQTTNSSEDFLSLAKEQIKKGDLQAALVSYQKAIAVSPKDAFLYSRLGDLYSQHFKKESLYIKIGRLYLYHLGKYEKLYYIT